MRCNIYISRLCYDASVRLSVRLSLTFVHCGHRVRSIPDIFACLDRRMSLLHTDNASPGSSDGMMPYFWWKRGVWKKLADRAIYFNFRNFFVFLLGAKLSQYLLDRPIFTIFSPNGRYLREFSWLGPLFPIPQGTLPWQPILFRTGLVRSEPKYLRIRWTGFHNCLHHMVDIEWQMINPTFFFRYLKGSCHGNQLI